AIEAEFADWQPSKGAYDLSPRNSPQKELYQLEEEENAYISAVQLLKEMGPGRAEAEAVWKTCVLREKLRLVRSMAGERRPPSREVSVETADEVEDMELCPENWPEDHFRPQASDFAFNFAELDVSEQQSKAETKEVLASILRSWYNLASTHGSSECARGGHIAS
ncbi:unnamed protein product, partial [Effrenium voratum]